MESFLPVGSLGLPLPQRLSRLYNDTKKSSDFVKEPVQNAEDPEIKALHRKLRIQKDRLVSWGLEWSEPSHSAAKTAEIDVSLAKAGVSDVVSSIMSTIKDILAEAEPLWLSSKRLVDKGGAGVGGGGGRADKSPIDIKIPSVVWDKGRFEDLVRDLTASIDTLYDVSRTRSSALKSGAPAPESQPQTGLADAKTAPALSEDLSAFESSRLQTPQELDPSTLVNATTMQPSPLILGRADTRDVVFMSKQAYSELTHKSKPWAPLLLEYAAFDPIYAATGIMPSMSRFERLCSGLQMESPRHHSGGAWNGLPHLLGYFADMQHAQLGLVYQFPVSFNPVSTVSQTRQPGMHNGCSLFSLSDLFSRPNYEPTLEAKFRLANNLAHNVFDMHGRGISHGNLTDKSIVFCNAIDTHEIDIRRPVVTSFELFPDNPSQEAPLQPSLYRHPLDPRTTPASPLSQQSDCKSLDLWSLAMILSSIGTWCALENLVSNPSSPYVSESILPQIAIRCGTLYMKAVQACWNAVDEELAGETTGDTLMTKVQMTVTRCLDACCILDSVSDLEDRIRDDLGESAARDSAQTLAGPSSKVSTLLDSATLSPVPGIQQSVGKHGRNPPPPPPSKRRPAATSTSTTTTITAPSKENMFEAISKTSSAFPLDIKNDIQADQGEKNRPTSRSIPTVGPVSHPLASIAVQVAPPATKKVALKTRLYPNIPLPEDAVEQWNAIIMPQVNAALRSFYKKHAESVEISLESIGESSHKTQPTVLIVCSSVPKVRAIIKKKLGGLFDGSTQFGLKVCKGQVLRSRKSYTRRSMAGRKASDAGSAATLNQSFQTKPHNGASIGAWIGDRHLPPVSFGGLIVIDDKPYGMTVHHMLDDPDQESCVASEPILRSIGYPGGMLGLDQSYAGSTAGSVAGSSCDSEEYACEFSDDDEEEYDESDITSDDESDEEEDQFEDGDIPGVEPGCGDGYVVTQPAMDDVEDNFFASEESADEEHLDSFSLGEIYATSGIRRREAHGLIHEIDWALFEFSDDRLPSDNFIPRVQSKPSSRRPSEVHPTTVAPTSSLPGLEVQCIARTSGLQTGTIMPALTSVKIYGRTSPSHTYQVCRSAPPVVSDGLPMGIPGDSGAWVIDRRQGRLCGHVLAWSDRKQVAYICPMDVLLLDIAETLEATEVKLPGGDAVVVIEEQQQQQSSKFCLESDHDDLEDLVDVESDEAPVLVESSPSKQHSIAGAGGREPGYPKPPPAFGEVEMLELGVEKMKLGGVSVRAPV